MRIYISIINKLDVTLYCTVAVNDITTCLELQKCSLIPRSQILYDLSFTITTLIHLCPQSKVVIDQKSQATMHFNIWLSRMRAFEKNCSQTMCGGINYTLSSTRVASCPVLKWPRRAFHSANLSISNLVIPTSGFGCYSCFGFYTNGNSLTVVELSAMQLARFMPMASMQLRA